MHSSDPSAVLQAAFRRESQSLLQYVREAFPWARSGAREPVAVVLKVSDEEAHALADLAQFLHRRHVALPYLGNSPDYTGFNYVGVDFLLPRLVAVEREGIAHLEQDRAALAGDEAARHHVERLLEMKRRHLKQLEELMTPVPA